MESKTKVYAVIICYECDECGYYPDYENLYCVYSTKEKAEEAVRSIKEDDGFEMLTDAYIRECIIDEPPQ